jgi:glycosyltransferase involved in cell wall biosynthesis
LAACSRGEPFEVVVIDNNSEPSFSPAILDLPGLPFTRILREPRPGKWRALNRALDEGGLGEIVAVLDDDMSPEPDWIRAVLSSVRRLPEFDIFSGRSYVVWPEGVEPPSWARKGLAQGLLFSVFDSGSKSDVEFGVDSPLFPSGNHFWFRRSVLSPGVRFPDLWATEATFVVRLGALGHRGVFVPEAVVGHRIQPVLIDARVFHERASKYGRDMAHLEMPLASRSMPEASTNLRRWKRAARALATVAVWSASWLFAGVGTEDHRVQARARSLWGIALGCERLRLSQEDAPAIEPRTEIGDVGRPGEEGSK